ncbi:MAG: hypothetical protein GY731_10225, partial [Gammaproteobacteria bacterium]|nr:hypothetical protein [Gammaproteobacteria bacterium]
MSKNLRNLSARYFDGTTPFEELNRIARANRGITDQDLEALATRYRFSATALEGVRSFYEFLNGDSPPRKVHVCNGTACMLDRGPDRVRQALDAHLHSDAIGEMTCVGHCYQGGGFHVDGATF